MRMILKIAKKEIQQLFYSPIAWMLLVCFSVQTAVLFVARYWSMVYGTLNVGGFAELTKYIFTDQSGSQFVTGGRALWINVQDSLYLYIPLLTMGIVCREISNGTIKLMYSSPVRNSQIVLGKFVALMGYAALMMVPLLIYVLFTWGTVSFLDMPWVLTGLLGLYLLCCTYVAIGIFVSSLSKHQGIAAIASFLVFGFLNYVGKIGLPFDLVRDLTHWLSLKQHVSSFISGLICTEDLVYFVIMCATFLLLTIIRMSAVRQKTAKTLTLLRYGYVVAAVCVVAWVSTLPHLVFYHDVTSYQYNTLNRTSQEVLEQFEGKVTVTTYVNVLNVNYKQYDYPGFLIKMKEDFRPYIRFYPDMKVKTVYYYALETSEPNRAFIQKYPELSEKDLALKFCESEGISAEHLKSKEDLLKEGVDLSGEDYACVREFVAENGKRAFYRNPFPIANHNEGEITIAFKRLVMREHKVGYVTGIQERKFHGKEPLDYLVILDKQFERFALRNQGFDIVQLTLDKALPDGMDFVIIADPREKMTEKQIGVLEEYVARGGNLVFLGEPYRRNVQNPILRRLFGVELTELVVHPDLRNKFPNPANWITSYFQTQVCTELGFDRLKNSKICMKNTAGFWKVAEKGFQVFPLACTDTLGDSWTELETTDFANDTVRFNPAAGEQKGVFNTILALTREVNGGMQKIVIAGDADLFANENAGSGNYVMREIARWMADSEVPLYVNRPLAANCVVALSPAQFDRINWVFLVVIPLLIALGGITLWIRRRGR